MTAAPDSRTEEIRSIVEAIARALVDRENEVLVTAVVGQHSVVIELRVAPDDIGKVIGKKGIHADAIRRLVHAIAGKHKLRSILEIMSGTHPRP